ncbi:MAG TPA: type I DNA topoisomerase [Tepidisphaeraceae bacterium]|jgi:DNA topoisomerase-1|nr:type I DNA topoisomerase [Tepidisphaeraceae bacterium]
MAKIGKNLVIVESPAKAKTINKYLGDDYIVKASMGHIRDLPSSGMGVDLKTFEPAYVIIEERGKGKVVTELRKLAKDAPFIYLATDLDREGEAIAWHLKEALGVPDAKARRVIFNAITKSEIQKAFKNHTHIDIDRVNAQQARRILDRIVGYEISPLLWRKVARGLSAGRVQSVTVRLIVEREREIEAFLPEEYWKIGAIFSAKGGADGCTKLAGEWRDYVAHTGNGERTKQERERWLSDHAAFVAELVELSGKKFEINNKEDARKAATLLGFLVDKVETVEDPDAKGLAKNITTFVGRIDTCPDFVVRSIEKRRSTSRPPAPFITSTIQQAASSRLGYGAQRTMKVAQGLYEAGHITYMRTDSTNISAEALSMVRSYVGKEFGAKYLPEKANVYSSNKTAQEAHEAIRPTDVSLTPELARAKLGNDDARLYDLVWRRFVASQMSPAEFDQTAVTIVTRTKEGDAVFRATGRKLVFDGFMKVAGVSSEDQLLPELAEKQPVWPIEIDPTQHFTQPPPRFTEASLVKLLEQLGIGRPSTYASIIQTIQDRKYVEQLERRFYATLLGSVVTDKLIQAFPEIMNVQFTAGMETRLDAVEEKTQDWIKLLQDFYGPFHESVEGALDKIEHAGGAASPYKCPKCGKPMLYRISKTGFFLACSDAECKTTQPVDAQGKPTLREVSEFKCPVCGRDMIKRKGRFGEFLGCSGYSVKNEKGEPSCSTIINLDKEGKPMPPKPAPVKTGIKCEKCGSPMLLRDTKRGPFLGCSTFPKCRSTKMVKKLTGDDLKQVEALLPLLKESAEKAKELAVKIVGETPAANANAPVNIATDIDCEDCGKPMTIRSGRRGKFLGCSGYPKCKNTAEIPAKLLEELGLNGKEGANGAPASAPAEKEADEPEEIETDLLVE